MKSNAPDRPSTFDEFGDRVWLYPAEVKGYFRNLRTLTQWVLIVIFLVLPWIKIGGTQAILLDIPHRRFALFGLTLFAHDAPLFFFVLAGFVVGLIWVTSVWGRVWCGWACPQTVFIDGLFRKIETLFEGHHLKRRALDREGMSLNKFLRKAGKWSFFILATLVITHSFLAYFVGADELWLMIQRSPKENWTAFLVIVVTTGLLLFDLTWFREQFCIIMCPYGRFQSVLMDRDSMAVIYDESRGEPRKGKQGASPAGDCVNCNRCVAVCPTGIDIREGVQMDCIACTACIDACDEIMDKVKKPRGLIRYASERSIRLKTSFHPRLLKARPLITLASLLALLITFAVVLGNRDSVHIAILRAPDIPYRKIQDPVKGDRWVNHFKLHVKNHKSEATSLSFALPPELADKDVVLIIPQNPLPLGPGEDRKLNFFVSLPEKVELPPKKQSVLVIQLETQTWKRPLPLVTPRISE